jgi:hypothetical protein
VKVSEVISWVGRVVRGSILAVVVTVAATCGLKDLVEPVRYPPADVERVHAREVQVAQALGFSIAEDGPEHASRLSRRIEVQADECVAVIASAGGRVGAHRLVLAPDGERATAAGDIARALAPSDSPVQHVQACTRDPDVWIATASLGWEGAVARVTVLRGASSTIGGNGGLNRGWVPRDEPALTEQAE